MSFPFIFASLPAGNNPASDLDAALNATSILWRTWINSTQQRGRRPPEPRSTLPLVAEPSRARGASP